MKTSRRVPLKKENSTDNYYKDSLKPRPISFSPKKNTTSQSRIPIPLPKTPKQRPEALKIFPVTVEKTESEIEAKLRLKLKSEFIQKYHLLQNKFDDKIAKSSTPLDSSFLSNLTLLFSIQQQNQLSKNNNIDCLIEEEEEEIDEYEYEYEYEYVNEDKNTNTMNENKITEIKNIEKEIENQKQKHNSLQNEIEKNKQILLKIKSDISDSLNSQNRLQNEQNAISNQIEEAYIRNSNLFLELNAMKEQKQFEMHFNELLESFDGSNGLLNSKYPNPTTQGGQLDAPQVSLKASTITATQNQTSLNSFENSSQPLINLTLSTDSEEDPMLLYLNHNGSKSNSNTNIENDSLDESSLDENVDGDNYEINEENADIEYLDDGENNCDTKTEYNCHVEDYIMTDEEVLTYTTKYEEQKQFTLETMIETQEPSTTIVETFEMKPPGTYYEEEEYLDENYDEDENNRDEGTDHQELPSNKNEDQSDDDLNSNDLPKELFRSPYRIRIPIRPPKK